MKKFLWIILAIVMFPLMPFPIIAFLVIYSIIKRKQNVPSFSTSWTWPPKTDSHSPVPTPTHIHRGNSLHNHKKIHTSSQELRLRLGIIMVGILLIALFAQNLLN